MYKLTVIVSRMKTLMALLECTFLDPEGGSQKATLVALVGISSLKIQRSATKLCAHIRAHIPYKSTVSDFKINF